MNYVITFVKDTEAYMKELEAMAPSYIATGEDGVKSSSIQHTPTVRNQNGSLALSAISDYEVSLISTMTTIENLGTYEELFASPDNLSKYKSVYPYDVPLSYVDDEGNTVEYYLPEKIGVFA